MSGQTQTITNQTSNTSKPNLEKGFSQVGTRVADGTIYGGISPETGEGLYIAPQDTPAPGYFKWQEAMKYAEELSAHNYSDWRLPTKAEFNVLKENQYKGALKELFDRKSSYPTGYYWSSTETPVHKDGAFVQKFGGYGSCDFSKEYSASVRVVRTGPVLPNTPDSPSEIVIAP